MYGIQFLGVLELEIVGRKPGLNFVEMKNNCYKYNRIYGCYEQQLEKNDNSIEVTMFHLISQ